MPQKNLKDRGWNNKPPPLSFQFSQHARPFFCMCYLRAIIKLRFKFFLLRVDARLIDFLTHYSSVLECAALNYSKPYSLSIESKAMVHSFNFENIHIFPKAEKYVAFLNLHVNVKSSKQKLGQPPRAANLSAQPL